MRGRGCVWERGLLHAAGMELVAGDVGMSGVAGLVLGEEAGGLMEVEFYANGCRYDRRLL